MSLIDTQVVINLIADIQYDDRYIGNSEVFVALETVRDCIFNLPTTYDVDRVLEELNEEYEPWLRGYNQTLSMGIDSLWRDLSGRAYGVSEAIEIVKGGWVDESRA